MTKENKKAAAIKFDRDKLVQETALKLRRLREELGYNQTEMSEWLGIKRTTLIKYENGETFPFAQTLVRLGEARNISLDWFVLNKGPRLFDEKEQLLDKENRETLEKTVEQLQADLQAEREKCGALEQEKQIVEQEKEKLAARVSELEKRNASVEGLPGVRELLDHIVKIPLLYHEVLGRFQRFKIDNRELVESSMNQEG